MRGFLSLRSRRRSCAARAGRRCDLVSNCERPRGGDGLPPRSAPSPERGEGSRCRGVIKLSLLLAAVVALALAGPASAKWIDTATITGPGVERPIVTGGEFLFDSSGFYAATFGPTTDLLPAPPTKRLGPRYTVLYSLPGPERVRVRQDLYPYAAGGPVTYTDPGQPLYDGQRTRGGWYAGTRDLKDAVASIGLPRTAPALRDRDRHLWLLEPTGAIVLGALLLVARRRRA